MMGLEFLTAIYWIFFFCNRLLVRQTLGDLYCEVYFILK